MTTTNRYQIQLTPVKKFYFGGDTVFNPDDKQSSSRDKEGRKTSYIVKSNYFPQQTTLLGALRYLLLQQNGLLGKHNVEAKNREAAKKLIGEKGFFIESPITDTILDFGVIKSLSPVYIHHNNQFYSAAPLDLGFEFETVTGRSYTTGIKQLAPVLKGYDAKKDLPSLLLSISGNCLDFDAVFLEHEQIGIDRNYGGQSQDNAFYKQTFLSFKDPDTAFSFEVELSSTIDIKKLDRAFLNMGGDGSRFKVSISNYNELEFTAHPPKCSHIRAVLLSDAFAGNSIYQHSVFAITKAADFRCLQTSLDTENYYNINKNDAVTKSTKLNLLQKGSVFYFENEEGLKAFEAEMNTPRFVQIGYNKFYTTYPNN